MFSFFELAFEGEDYWCFLKRTQQSKLHLDRLGEEVRFKVPGSSFYFRRIEYTVIKILKKIESAEKFSY